MLAFVLGLAADLTLDVSEDAPASVDVPALVGVVRQGKRGSVVASGTRATYTPQKDVSGADSFVVEVKGEKKNERVTVNVVIRAVNDLPVVEAMLLQPKEDGSAGLPLTLKDVDSERFTFAIGTPPQKGRAEVSKSGRVSFTGNKDANGKDRFVVIVDDGAGKVEAPIDVDIVPVNDAPVIEAVTLATKEDEAASVALRGSDVDGDKLVWAVAKGPARGAASVDGSTLKLAPGKDANGADSVVVSCSDGKSTTTVTVPVTITAVNDAPVVEPMTLNLREDESGGLPLTLRDVDSTRFTFAVKSQGKKGSATVDARGRVTFTPAKNENGKDAFSVSVSDGEATVERSIDVVIAPVNDAPVLTPAEQSTAEDQPADFSLSASDVDGDKLTWSVAAQPARGKASVNDKGAFTFAPAKDVNGKDSFVVAVSDGSATTTATVSVNVSPVNDAPVVEPMTLQTREEEAVGLPLTVRDVDGDAVSFSVGKQGEKGSASVDAKGRVRFAPNKDKNGNDRFSVFVSDGTAKVEAPVDVVIAPINDAPVLTASRLTGEEDGALQQQLQGSDVDGDALAYALAKAPAHGDATVDGKTGALSFTPHQDWYGEDSLVVTASDGHAVGSTVVLIALAPVNDAPVVEPMTLQTREEEAVGLPLTVRDVDGDAVSFVVDKAGSKGTASVDAKGRVRFAPSKDANGNDRFVVVVSDGKAKVSAPVDVVIAAVNDAPVIDEVRVQGNEDVVLSQALAGSDVDGDKLAWSISGQPAHGSAVLDGDTVRITPQKDWHGTDSVTVTLKDGTTSTSRAVPIVVAAVNDPPVVDSMVLQTREEEGVGLPLTVRDVDGDAFTFAIGTPPANGSANVDARGRVTYTPEKDHNGKDAFIVLVKDGTAQVPAPVDVVIAPVNDAPIATAAAFSVAEDGQLQVTLVGEDVDGDALSFSLVKAPAGRLLLGTEGALAWAPPHDFHGSDKLTFEVDDGKLRGRAEVALTVTPVNDAPVLTTQPLSTREDKAGSSRCSATDVDGDALKFAIKKQGEKGEARVDASGSVTFTPSPDKNGKDVVVVEVADGTTTVTQELAITIAPEPDAPRIASAEWSFKEDEVATASLPAADVDGDALTFSLVGSPRHGSVALVDAKSGKVTFSPKLDEHGPDEVRFEVSDGTSKVAGVLPVVIAPVNDAPVASPLSLATAEDTPVKGTVNMSDVDGDVLQLLIAQQPKKAKARVENAAKGTIVVEPDPDFAGELVVLVKAQEKAASSAPVEVKVTVTPVNDAPTASARVLDTAEDQPLKARLEAADVDGDALSFRIKLAPGLGALTLDDKTGAVVYTPRKNAYGVDSFSWVVSDGKAEALGKTTVRIAAVDDPPTAADGLLLSPRAGRVTGKLLGRDPEGAPLRYQLLSQPSDGKVTLISETTGEYAYTAPGGSRSGKTSFTYVVSDGTTTSAPGTVVIDVQ